MKKILTLGFVFFLTTTLSSQSLAGGMPQKLPEKRGPASFTQGFKVLSKTCKTRKAPSVRSRGVFSIPSGKKVWLTAMDSQWMIAKTQSSKDVYIHTSCLN